MAAPTISTLPHELLGEIFTQYASICPDAPIVLGAVSRLFRHVAYTTPTTWSHLALSDADGSRKATLWFKLSKACRVDVQIDMARVGRLDHGVDALAVKASVALQTLRFHTNRITSLCLRTDTQAQARAALATIYSDIPPTCTALRSLRISAAVAPAPGSQLAFPAIPSITGLESTNVTLALLPSLDLGKLRNLRLVQPILSAPVVADDILELVHVAPGLRRLQVEARIADPSGAPTGAELCFPPQLIELHLRANNVVALLDRFIVPALRVLHLNDLDGKRANASADIGAALHRLLVRMELGEGNVVSNELRVFELIGVEVERKDAVWERCLQRMKAVKVFNVNSPNEKEKECAVQDDIATVEPRPRPLMSGFGFGFGALEVDFPARHGAD
jgi:hypothetical protein